MICLRMPLHVRHGVVGYGDRCIDKSREGGVKIPKSNSSTHSSEISHSQVLKHDEKMVDEKPIRVFYRAAQRKGTNYLIPATSTQSVPATAHHQALTLSIPNRTPSPRIPPDTCSKRHAPPLYRDDLPPPLTWHTQPAPLPLAASPHAFYRGHVS